MNCKHCGVILINPESKSGVCLRCYDKLRNAGAYLLLWIVREADPYTSKEDWPDPESFGYEVIRKARAAVEALRSH